VRWIQRHALESGKPWNLASPGIWQALESGKLWNLASSGIWQALESGKLWNLERRTSPLNRRELADRPAVERQCRTGSRIAQ
jgi:hypothetical protein